MIETERLILRQWRDEDYPIFAQLNADPTLMSREESDAQADRISRDIANNGWGFWAVVLKSSGKFIGLISQRVMIKAGMTNTGEDFNHPQIPAGHALAHFCLYHIAR